MKKRVAIIISLFFIFVVPHLFAEINLVSPVEGTWANRQLLLIDNTKNGDYFYSIDGADPEKFGFAYDGPVLLDTNGKITLKVAYISRDGKKESTSVTFNVVENEAKSTPHEQFISSFYDSGILNYSSGSKINIPSNLFYSLGFTKYSYISGRSISISEKSILTRNIPCVIYDKSSETKWRFIIKTFPQSAGTYSRRDVPFSITDWDTISFNDDNLLYKIDSEYWELPKKPKTLDRSVSHMISWQSLEYNAGNPIEFFVLPPKPEVCFEKDENGGVRYYIDGDSSYSMSILSSDGKNYQELFTEFGIDTFFGDKVSGDIRIGVFTNSVYQGEITTKYSINKCPPSDPEIKTNVKTLFTRDNVIGTIDADPGSDLYVSMSKPVLLNNESDYTSENFVVLDSQPDDYVNLNTDHFSFTLHPEDEGAFYYKLKAYSKNGDNVSQISEYQVIIDQYNYYFDSTSSEKNGDGTAQKPFTDFKKCIKALNKSDSISLKVKGELIIPTGKYELCTNCYIENNGNASIVFEGDSCVVFKNASVDLTDFRIISKRGKSNTIIPNIKLENSVLTIKNVEASLDFNKNGSFIDSYNSVININESITSLTALSYVSFISSVKSRIGISNSTINSNADSTVILSSHDGQVVMKNNSFKAVGTVGRIAELFNTNALLENNIYNVNLSKKGDSSVVYTDKTSEITDRNNVTYGL